MILVFPVAELPCMMIPPEVGRSVVKCSKISRNIHFRPTKTEREKESVSYMFLVLILLKIVVLGTSKNNGLRGQSPVSMGTVTKRILIK